MGKEIERKFLVKNDSWRGVKGAKFRQGYLHGCKERTVRVRTTGNKGYLTIKGITIGTMRLEYEYEVPVSDANEMLVKLCEKPLIEKVRYIIPVDDFMVEVDEFLGENEGLIVAEVELESECQTFRKPDWLGKEVSGDSRYFNYNLAKHPYTKW